MITISLKVLNLGYFMFIFHQLNTTQIQWLLRVELIYILAAVLLMQEDMLRIILILARTIWVD